MVPFKPLALAIAVSLTVMAPGNASEQPSPATPALSRERPHHVYLIGALRITQPWIDVGHPDPHEAAAYLIVENRSDSPDRLTGASLAGAADVSLAPPDGTGFVVPPMGTLTLKPGDAHLVLHGISGIAAKGPPVDGTIRFERSGSVHISFLTDPAEAAQDDQTTPSLDQPVDIAK